MNKLVLGLSILFSISCTLAYFFYTEMEQHKECGQFAILTGIASISILLYNKKVFNKWVV